MMKPLAKALLFGASFAFCGCEVHKDISLNRAYWKNINRFGQYEVLKPVNMWFGSSHYDKARWDMQVVPLNGADIPVDLTLPSGTIIQPQWVYRDSSPLQYLDIEYGATIVGGKLNGKRIEITNLLIPQAGAEGARYPNPHYLRIKSVEQ